MSVVFTFNDFSMNFDSKLNSLGLNLFVEPILNHKGRDFTDHYRVKNIKNTDFHHSA